MKFLRIQNKGELDIRLVSLMGGSTKSNDTTKIGKFGTGLKYSLSWLVRNKINFRIFIGMREVSIEVRSEEIQGVTFEVLYINGERSSITSNMGVDWEGWMVCREIWCNAIDAGHPVKNLCTDIFVPDSGTTTFYIENVGEIKDAVEKWEHYFIDGIAPIYDCKNFALYPPREVMTLYKNGVMIKREKNFKSLYSYDIKNASINELREYKGWLPSDMFAIVREMPKEIVLDMLSNVKSDHYEYDMDYDWGTDFSHSWKEALTDTKIVGRDDHQILEERGIAIDCMVVPQGIFNKLSQTWPGLSAVKNVGGKSSSSSIRFFETYDADMEAKVSLAISAIKDARYSLSSKLSIKTGVFGNKSVMSTIDQDVILLSNDLRDASLTEVMSYIIKENEMFEHDISLNDLGEHFAKLYAAQLLK